MVGRCSYGHDAENCGYGGASSTTRLLPGDSDHQPRIGTMMHLYDAQQEMRKLVDELRKENLHEAADSLVRAMATGTEWDWPKLNRDLEKPAE